jgi:predicted ferric reductase
MNGSKVKEQMQDNVLKPKRTPVQKKTQPFSFRTLMVVYFCIVLIPYGLGFTSDHVSYRGWYTEFVTILSMGGFSMMLGQFLLSGRMGSLSSKTGVDNGMLLHRKVGEYLALLFFLHPFLIVLPRFWISSNFAIDDMISVFTENLTLNGFYAWALMIVWVLMSMFKDKLNMPYEAWRITHGIGAIAIVILATDHVITIGRHGHYEEWFDWFWIALCTGAVSTLVYTHFIRPRATAKKPFKVVSCEKAGSIDWYLTLEKDGDFDFDFVAGQFVWLNTSGNAYDRTEHPFSIATSPSELPKISFVIRALGDYTSNLGDLKIGQLAYIDGPHGVFTLADRNAKGISLIAGGAGIGPIIGILRQLRDMGDPRPIRLVYGNQLMEQMVFQDEINAISETLDFKQMLVLTEPPENFNGHKGVMDRVILEKVFSTPDRDDWDYYLCGSERMVKAVEQTMHDMNIPKDRIIFEQLGF